MMGALAAPTTPLPRNWEAARVDVVPLSLGPQPPPQGALDPGQRIKKVGFGLIGGGSNPFASGIFPFLRY